ncbi:hypothetical protein MASR2M117_08390 [Paludibacter sp.]
MFGAEIIIEPGQNPENVDLWFRLLKENGFKITRLRMFEDYMKDAGGNWDFSLFDRAFKAGEKYDIKILGNLFPATSFDDIGGFKFPRDEKHWHEIQKYIEKTVTHFKDYKSLFGWVPVNEPGTPLPLQQEYTKNKFEQWKAVTDLPTTINGYRCFSLDKEKFALYYHPWFMNEVTREIQKYDKEHAIHLNPHGVLGQAEIYEFSLWREFLTSLGGSAHAGWHFDFFPRDRYATAMSATSEFLRSAAKELPWFMTEMQGGNNTYSGGDAMCPTSEDIAQWLWTIIGAGSKGGMFWCMNPRKSGVEAGEWAILDFQNEPTDRFTAAADIARIINKNEKMFSNAKVVDSDINILYVKEAVWVEDKLSRYVNDREHEARRKGGVIKSALGYFEALSQHGYNPNFGDINDFDFDRKNYANSVIILSNQVALPSKHWINLENYVKKGGTLIVEGMTAYYDENAVCIMNDYFPLKNLFGGDLSEFKFVGNLFDTNVAGKPMKAHLWEGFIKPGTGQVISSKDNMPTAIANSFGDGKVIWIPSLISMGAKISNEYEPLLGTMPDKLAKKERFKFRNFYEGALMKTLQSGNRIISVVISQNTETQSIELDGFDNYKLEKILYQNKNGYINKNKTVTINPQETIVIIWKQ